MSFRGQPFVFDSPAAAVAGMIARLRIEHTALRVESCDLESARGRVLAESVVADRDSPACDYSSMDGYAVRLSDLALPSGPSRSENRVAEHDDTVTLPVLGEARIGSAPPAMPDRPGAMRIVTGAGVPARFDAVIKREDVIEHHDEHEAMNVVAITLPKSVAVRLRAGDSIRRRGENARADVEVLCTGSVLSAAAIGTLAAVGCVHPRIYARLRLALIITGDELVPPDIAPSTFQIRNSNGPAINAALSTHAWIEVVSVVHIRDDAAHLGAALRHAIMHADAVVLSGGVSMGHRDPVLAAVSSTGAEIVFHGLPQRPGKPMLGAVAARADGSAVPLFGLPGNPVSAMVTCLRIVVPVLAVLAGTARQPSQLRVVLSRPDGKTADLWWHRPVRLEQGQAVLIDARSSGDVIAAGLSDGFIEVPPHPTAADHIPTTYSFYAWPT